MRESFSGLGKTGTFELFEFKKVKV